MLEIILARHGETDWNAERVFRGRADIPLNDTGVRQAELLGEYLSRETIDIVYSSPLQRALKTASSVAAPHGLDVNVVTNLYDIDCGEWQGLSVEKVEAGFPGLYQDWLDTPEQVRLPGGETLEDVRARVMPFIQDVVIRCGEGRVVLVSHRLVFKVVICALLGLSNSSVWCFQLDTGGISRFVYDGGRVVLTAHNFTGHLKPAGRFPPVDF
jgi:broad specificity phosphatase PhoE